VDESDQGKIQGALTSLGSLTNIAAPLFFTAGLFQFFTGPGAPYDLPGAPLIVGGCLLFLSLVIARGVFRRHPR
jgi:DHA1 family tetracycline resistance protein-like MFS transporter